MVKEGDTMKKIISVLMAAALIICLAACGSTAQAQPVSQNEQKSAAESPASETEAEAPSDQQTPAATEPPVEVSAESGSRILVLFFSRTGEQYQVGVIEKGNTAIVAEMVAEATGADLYEVLPADDHYPMTYKELTDVALQEQRDRARPAYAGAIPDMNAYDTIFIGAPVWWGDWPMIMYTVFENTPLSGKTLIPFSTHAGSGLSGFDRSLANQYPDCTVAKGLAIAGTDAQNNPDKVQSSVAGWLGELGF